MAFFRASIRAPMPARVRVAVFAVGRRVYIAAAGDRSARATLTDRADRPLASLSDGAEVTILGWLPGVGGATRYSVRVTDSGLEGWLPVAELRGTQAAISSPLAAPPAPAVRPAPRPEAPARSAGRRFGQR